MLATLLFDTLYKIIDENVNHCYLVCMCLGILNFNNNNGYQNYEF